jgi:hypothetical protein
MINHAEIKKAVSGIMLTAFLFRMNKQAFTIHGRVDKLAYFIFFKIH